MIHGYAHMSGLSGSSRSISRHFPRHADEAAEVKEVPVCYGGEFGPDLEEVASFHSLSVEDVIRLHCAPLYRVYMIGFTPGFAYLGGLDERLHTRRKSEPRKRVPGREHWNCRSADGHLPHRKPRGVAAYRQDPPEAL